MIHSKNKIPIVYYHSIGPSISGWARSFLSIEAESFENHLLYLKKNYTIIDLNEYHGILSSGNKIKSNYLVITIDDGYLDNWVYAFPLLEKYKVKATIFISPEFVDPREIIRKKTEEIRIVNHSEDIQTAYQPGYLSWNEIKIMQESGLVDFQSHTMTHTKYPISEKIIGFHKPGGDILHEAGNLFKEKKPYNINNLEFEKLLPYGYPIFEKASAIVARRVMINQDFLSSCFEIFNTYNFQDYSFESAFKKIENLYKQYRENGNLITNRESEKEYIKRIRYEIIESKRIIEIKLSKPVNFLCWPHGDNSETAHQIAIDNGYLMTTLGKFNPAIEINTNDRIPQRIGVNFMTYRKRAKTLFKLKASAGFYPYSQLYDFMKSIKLKK